MLRLIWSVVLAALIGGGVAAIAIKLLGIVSLGALSAYPLAILVGIVIALMAGKPVWAHGAKLESALKAVFGAVGSIALMYGLRRWLGFELDLSSYGLGQGAAGLLSIVAFPAVALVLSLLFEVDNLLGKDAGGDKKRIAESGGTKRLANQQAEVEEEFDTQKAGRRRR